MAGLNLMDMVMSAAGGQVTNQLASQFGLSNSQSKGAISALMPAISAALKNNASQEGGLQSLLEAAQRGNKSAYIDNPQVLAQQSTVNDGNGILGHLFGSKDVSRQVASAASTKTGLDSAVLKKFLPIVAALAMGSISKQTGGGVGGAVKSGLAGMAVKQLMGGSGAASGVAGMLGSLLGGGRQQQSQASGLGMLGNLLDAGGDHDDGIMDDVLGMAMKQFLK